MRLIDPLPGHYDASDPFGNVRPSGKAHLGSDWIVPSGTPVPAIGSGVVANKGYTSYNGTYVTVGLPDGHYYAYIHLQDVLVNVGDTVTIGQIIAHSDQSGSNANIPGLGGPHLHITVSNTASAFDGLGSLIDPWAFIQLHKNDTDPATPTPEEENMSYSLVKDAQSGTVFACSLVTGKRVGITSMTHVAFLQRFKKNNVDDPMFTSELDIVKGYLSQINP